MYLPKQRTNILFDKWLYNPFTIVISCPKMDLLFQATSFFRRRKFEQCAEVTTRLLEKNPNDQVRTFYKYEKKQIELI
jgi:hypothetical protein